MEYKSINSSEKIINIPWNQAQRNTIENWLPQRAEIIGVPGITESLLAKKGLPNCYCNDNEKCSFLMISSRTHYICQTTKAFKYNRHIRDTNYDHPLPQIKKIIFEQNYSVFNASWNSLFPFKDNRHTTVCGTFKHLTILVKRGRDKVYILHFLSIKKKNLNLERTSLHS